MFTKFTIYLNGMTIGVLDDANLRVKGEAQSMVDSLVRSFLGQVEYSTPFKDRNHQSVNLFSSDKTHPDFMAKNCHR